VLVVEETYLFTDPVYGRGPVLPHAPTVFQLKVLNRGVVKFRLELFTYDEDNIGLLSLDGSSHTFNTIPTMEPLYSTHTLYRGSACYEYPAIKLGF
jgi:hypothetical protein